MAVEAKNSNQIFDLVSEVLRPGHVDDFRRIFLDAGAGLPAVIWSPERSDIRNSLLRQFYDACKELAADTGEIAADDLSLDSFGALADWLMLVDLGADGELRYLYYGGAIADVYGKDMTGQKVRSIGGYISGFFAAVYSATSERRTWVYTEHEPPLTVFVRSWHRLIIPLTNKDGTISRFLAMNVPENELSTGLELLVDPVFVINEDRHVVFCNEAAQTLFRLPRKLEAEKELSDLTGIALDTSMSPSEMLKSRRREDTTELALRGAIVERLVVTTSAAQLRGKAYYVVVMRMLGA